MSEAPLLLAENLSRYYGRHRAIEAFSLRLNVGEVLGLLGPNGAGKTTTLNLLSGCLAPSGGRVEIDGIDLLERPLQAKRRLGYLPENPPLYDDLSIDEYLRYCARLHGLRRAEVPAAMKRAKQRTALDKAGRALIGTLSKGFRQRVGIAQALIHQPPLIILDEPTVGLDPLQIKEIRALIGELRNEHAVILSTHILTEVQSVCDRVCILDRGRPVYSDSLTRLAAFANTWRVTFSNPPDAHTLGRVAGISAVQSLGEGRFLMQAKTDAGSADALVQAACMNGWKLRELCLQQDSLEQIFLRVLHAEGQEEATA